MAQDIVPLQPLPPVENGDGSGGGDQLANDLVSGLTAAPAAPVAPAAPAAPVATAKPYAPAAPVAPAAPAKPAAPAAAAAPASPAAQSKPVNIDDPKLSAVELRKHLKEMKGNYEMTVAEKEKALQQVQSRIKDLEQKKYWTAEDQKRVDALEAGRKELEAKLYGRNYSESEDYKKNFVEKINSQAAEAQEILGALNVTVTDAEGSETTRTGNQADMMRLYNATNNMERRRMAKELFGEDFQEALDAVSPMLQTRKDAERAVKEKAENYEADVAKFTESTKAYRQQVEGFVKQATDQLSAANPEIFGNPTDASEAEAFKRGFAFVDEATQKADTFTPEERAARVAVVRSMAGAFPRMAHTLSKVKAELAAAQEELAKYRKSDPSNIGDGGGGGGENTDNAGGVDSMAAEFDKLGS